MLKQKPEMERSAMTVFQRTPTPHRKHNFYANKERSAATQIAYHQLVKSDPRELVGLLTFGKKRLPSRFINESMTIL